MPAMGGSDKPEDREFSELNWVSSTSEPSPEKPEPSPEQEEGEKATPEWDEDAPTCARTLTIEEIAAADAAHSWCVLHIR